MDEKEAIQILMKLKNNNNFNDSINKALRLSIQSLERQVKIKKILNTPTLFIEKFHSICEIEEIYKKNNEL